MHLEKARMWSRLLPKLILLVAMILGRSGPAEGGGEHKRRHMCMEDAWSSEDGRVVVYDTVVNVLSRRLFFIGPHKKLWIVPVTPDMQARTAFFPDSFQQSKDGNIDEGSTCTFSFSTRDGLSSDEEANIPPTGSLRWRNRTTSAYLMRDPIKNMNVVHCSITNAVMAQIEAGAAVRVQLRLQSMDEGGLSYSPMLPVCMEPRPKKSPAGSLPAHASLCCIIRDEGRYLVEWIEYSRMIGVDHFFLYDHGSVDDTQRVSLPQLIRPYSPLSP